jgi:hypothetical protein
VNSHGGQRRGTTGPSQHPGGLRIGIRASDQVKFPDRLANRSFEQLHPEPADRGAVLVDAYADHQGDYLADADSDPDSDQLTDAHHHDQPADVEPEPVMTTPPFAARGIRVDSLPIVVHQ